MFVSFVSEEVGEERGAVGRFGGPLQRPDRSLSPSPLRALVSRVVRFNRLIRPVRPDRQAGERSALCRTACLAQ
ncbi:hypothetical protein NDU88_005203 [Pleurodeles waltl]|uniref:Uncharacterized protein n=1 Tax=Pleurodeles waltl TaxID=8319 RepID=A0AAV7MXM9_PLEWA|nr:hypothetical protein NDU88_005203 [Pleurodeles waltl]